MPTVLLVRHGRTAANASGVLAGWTPGVDLDDTGREQAAALAERLARVPVAAVVTSPLERCVQTAAAVVAGPRPRRTTRGEAVVDDRLGECRYGDWTGRPLAELAKEPLWRVVQDHPSAARFPGEAGESLSGVQHRAVEAVREWDARVAAEHGDHAVWVAVSHGDVIKAVLAEALGQHLDLFQRIVVDPCSVSAVRFAPLRPFVLRTNDTGGDLAALVPPRTGRRRPRGGARAGSQSGSTAGSRSGGQAGLRGASDAPVGGGAGSPSPAVAP